MKRFWFALAVTFLMALYLFMIDAATAHVVGLELPPLMYFGIATLAPVVLMLANALPSLFELLPGAQGTIPTPNPTQAAALLTAAHEALKAAQEPQEQPDTK